VNIYTCEVIALNGMRFMYEVTDYSDSKSDAANRAKRYHNRHTADDAFKAYTVKVKSVRMVVPSVRSI
jgi:hypothetical protein